MGNPSPLKSPKLPKNRLPRMRYDNCKAIVYSVDIDSTTRHASGAQPGRHSVNKSKFFGRINDAGTVDVFHVDGSAATRLDANVYPVSSRFSARYEHPGGITLHAADAQRIGLRVEV